jgi:hypothetical protein
LTSGVVLVVVCVAATRFSFSTRNKFACFVLSSKGKGYSPNTREEPPKCAPPHTTPARTTAKAYKPKSHGIFHGVHNKLAKDTTPGQLNQWSVMMSTPTRWRCAPTTCT